MKVLKIIKKIVLTILGVLFFAFALLMTVLLLNFNKYGITQFKDTSIIIVNNEITSDNYKDGDLVFVKSKKLDKIKVGDEIFTYTIDEDKQAHVGVGKVGEIFLENDSLEYENGSTYSMEFVIGESTKVYSKIGSYLSIVESKWGFLFIVLVPGFLVFIYEIYALIVEIKYGGEEE